MVCVIRKNLLINNVSKLLKACLLLHKIWFRNLKKNLKVAKLKRWQLSINWEIIKLIHGNLKNFEGKGLVKILHLKKKGSLKSGCLSHSSPINRVNMHFLEKASLFYAGSINLISKVIN